MFLNIFTPFLQNKEASLSKLKPVVFHIRGGGFLSGTGSDPTFDRVNVASRGDVVLVTINHDFQRC